MPKVESLSVGVYGQCPSQVRAEISASLEAYGFGAKLAPMQIPKKKDLESLDLVRHDVLLVFFATGDKLTDAKAAKFLKGVVELYGAWSFLPAVVVGEPQDPRLSNFYRINPARLLDGTAEPKEIADAIQHAFRACWWYSERDGTLPAMVINRNGLLIRANAAAERLFSGASPGSPYMSAVEESAENLPEDHPIAQALKEQAAKVEDRIWQRKDAQGEKHSFSAFLLCHPILTPSETPWCAALWILDRTGSDTVLAAYRDLHQAKKSEDLYAQIVQRAVKLGFERVRLYEYDEREMAFFGKAELGYDSVDRARFLDGRGFKLSLDCAGQNEVVDPSLYIIEKKHDRPFLVIPNSKVDRIAGLTYESTKPARWAKELKKEHVTKWIEAPIWLPPIPGRPATVPWGKLSIDRDGASDGLTTHDLRDVALYCRVVGSAVAAVRLDEDNKRALAIIGTCSPPIAESLSGNLESILSISMRIRESVEKESTDRAISVFDVVIAKVLDLCLQATGGDVALYRQQEKDHPDGLRRRGPILYAKPDERNRHHVPVDFSCVASIDYFGFFGPNPKKEAIPQVIDDPRPMLDEILKQLEEKEKSEGKQLLSDQERTYLREIRSEMHVPISEGARVIGVLVIVAWTPAAFTKAVPLIANLMHVISAWLDLARRQAGRQWVNNALHAAIALLPRLDVLELDRDFSWYAGLATLLSAHNGLSWNRVFIFACDEGTNPFTARLVYALGGLANPEDVDYQRQLQERVGSLPDSLDNLVGRRLENPSLWKAEYDTPNALYDKLYRQCIAFRTESDRPEIHYNPLLGPVPDRRSDPLVWLLRQQYPLPESIDIPLEIDLAPDECRWVKDQKKEIPGIFGSEGKVYVFPLWSPCSPGRQPLGVVLVDNTRAGPRQTGDMIEATRLFLRVTSDLLAVRKVKWLWQGWVDNLPVLFHDKYSLKVVSDEFSFRLRHLKDLANGLQTPPDLREKLRGLQDNAKELTDGISAIYKSSRLREKTCQIDDFVALLKKENGPNSVVFITRCQAPPGLAVPCEPRVLHSALKNLTQNTAEAYQRERRVDRPRGEIRINVIEDPVSCANFSRLVEIHYEDEGPGIDPVRRPYVFLDGYASTPDALKPRGRGLALVKAQLIAYHGDIRVEEPSSGRGAHFVITFGIPKPLVPIVEVT
jgi:anti-sigma regulatory factor (Ser/Thr protein kinase)